MFRLFTMLRSGMASSPLITNCLVYGSMSGMAEFSQQTLMYKVFPKKGDEQKYNKASIFQYTVLGGVVFSPALHFWYRWLDRMMPGTGVVVVAKKVALDIGVFGVPYYTAFYILLNIMAGETMQASLAELRQKLVPAMLTKAAFWVPAQVANFRYVPPRLRIVYMAGCTFVEFNILALFKKWDGRR